MRKPFLTPAILLILLVAINAATLPASLQAIISSSSTSTTTSCPAGATSCTTAVPVINYVSTDTLTQGTSYRIGGLLGNVLLYLKGTGLSSDVSATVVMIGDQVCQIDAVYTSSNQIACDVPPSDAFGIKTITVTISGKVATCDPSICYFDYDMSWTPILSYLSPVAVNPVSEIKFGGIFRVTNSLYLELTINDYLCDTSSYGQQPIVSDSVSFVKCTVGTLPAGFYDATLNVLTKGTATTLDTAYALPDSSTGHLYNFTVLPEILALSSHQGTTAGQILTITGTGFSQNPLENQVLFGDTSCFILYSVYQSIQCYLLQPAVISATGLIPGHAGLTLRTFSASTTLDQLKQSSQFLQGGGSKSVILSAETEYDKYESYSEAIEGFFKAPVSGTYKFLLSAQGAAELYLSQEPLSSDNLTLLASISSGTGFRDFFNPSEPNQISQGIDLEAGQYYYLQAIHLGVGTEHITIGAVVPNQVRKYNSLRTVFSINIAANVTLQQATFRFKNSTSTIQITAKSGATTIKSAALTFPTTSSALVSAFASVGFAIQVQSRVMNTPTEVFYTFVFTNTSGLTPATQPGVSFPVAAQINLLNTGTPLVKGYFQLGILDTTLNFNFNETTDTVRDMIMGVPGIGMPRVTRYGTCIQGCQWIIQLDGNTENIPSPVIVSQGTLSGGVSGSLSLSLDILQDSSSNDLLFAPIPYDMLFTAETAPQINVKTKGLLATCPSFDCDYTVEEAITAVIVNFTLEGDTLHIFLQDGENLQSSDLQVYFADIEAQVISYDPDTQEIIAQIPLNDAGTPMIVAGIHIPQVVVNGNDFLAVSSDVTGVQINPTITNITINTEAEDEGFLLFTLTGYGYGYSVDNSYDGSIDIDGVPCWIYDLSNTQALCYTDVIIEQGIVSFTTNGLTATYALNMPPPETPFEVVNPPDGVSDTETGITVRGNFTNTTTIVLTNNDTNTTYTCDICTYNDTNIMCIPNGLAPGNYTVIANTFVPPNSFSQQTTNLTIPLEITSIEPQYGSQLGGTVITITGRGFSPVVNDNQVSLGQMNYQCNVFEANKTVVKCVTVANSYGSEGSQILTVLQRLEYVAQCNGDCNFYYSTENTPTLASLSSTDVVAGDSLTITGTMFTDSTQVKIAGVVADVVSFSDEEIIVTVPQITAGNNLSVTAYDPVSGFFYSPANLTVNHALYFDDYNPKIGSTVGSILTLTGKGFSSNVKVTVGSKTCTVLTTSTDTVTCRTAASSSGVVVVKQGNFNVNVSTAFASQTASTPSVTAITGLPISSAATQITLGFTGQNLAIDSPISVTLTSSQIQYEAEITSSSSTDIQAQFSEVSAGNYTLAIQVGSHIAKTTVSGFTGSVVVPLSVDTITPVQSSLAGGVELAITGAGFSNSTDVVSVTVEGFPCDITSSNFNQVTCTVPAFTSQATQPTYQFGNEVILTGTYFSNASTTTEQAIDAFDNNTITYFKASTSYCSIGVDFGQDLIAQLTQIQYYPRSGIDLTTLAGSVFEGSVDNINYVTIATLATDVYNGWNTISSPMANQAVAGFRYLRFRKNTASSKCEIAEVRAKGILFSALTPTDLTSVQASARLTVNGQSTAIANAVEYTADITPVVTSLSPALGSSKGDTELHLFGSNLDQTTEVKIDDVVCDITSVTATEVVCQTRALPPVSDRTERVTGTINLYAEEKGKAATNGVTFLYAEKWSDGDTWGCGGFPKEYDSVHVPTGMNLLVDVSPPTLVAVVVEGSLIFMDTDLTFTAEYILVRNGVLQIGTEEQPFQSKIDITLYGTKSDGQLPIFGNKVIGLYEGVIDIHGTPRVVSTTLATTANAQQTTIEVTDTVDWQVGERIAISSTGYDPSQTEEATIVSINGNTIELDQALNFTHIVRQTDQVQGQAYQITADVVLLSRNIIIHGDDTSSNKNYGAHLLFYDPGTESTIVRISYTEITKAGQTGLLGRFPVNFQNAGNQMRSFLKGNSIHHTYQRGIQLQGTHYLTVQENTVYAVEGYGINLESGSERFNTFEDNIVLSCRSALQHLSTQESAIGVRISHPTNFFRRNRILSNPNFGFWFDLKSTAVGAYANKNICPNGEKLGAFEDNYAAWNKDDGLHLDTYIPRTYPCKQDQYTNQPDPFAANPPVQAVFQNTLLIGNKDRGIQASTIGALVFDGLVAIDNGFAGIETYFNEDSPINSTMISNSIIIGSSDPATSTTSYRGIRLSRSEGLFIQNVTFVNFTGTKSALEIDALYSSGSYDSGARTVFVSGLQFINVGLYVNFANSATHIFRDLDGSLTGIQNGGWLVNNLPHLRNIEGCSLQLSQLSGLACDSSVTFRRVVFFGLTPATIYGLALKVLRLDNQTNTTDIPSSAYTSLAYRNVRAPSQSYALPFCLGQNYQVFFDQQIDFDILNFELSPHWIANDTSINFIFNHTLPREDYDLWVTDRLLGTKSVQNTTDMWNIYDPSSVSKLGKWSHDVNASLLYVGVKGGNGTSVKVQGYQCRVNCPAPPPAAGSNVTKVVKYWSDTTIWPSQVLPVEGDDVTIPWDWQLILDINPPALDTVEVQGDLIFDDTRGENIFRAKKIWVRGRIIVGTEDEPFPQPAKIILVGTRNEAGLLINDVIDVGTKVLGVTGQLLLYGQPVTERATLSQTVQPNSTVLEVNEEDLVGWEVGHHIALTSSIRGDPVYEVAKIASISGTTITLTAPVRYLHYSGVYSQVSGANTYQIDFTSQVILLNRSIEILGTEQDNWGAKIIVTDEYDYDYAITGQVDINYVSIQYCGQYLSEAALNFATMTNATAYSTVTGSVIRDSLAWGVQFSQAQNVKLINNTILNTYQFGIYFYEVNTDVTIQDNYILTTTIDSDTAYLEGITSGIYLNVLDSNFVTIADNVVAGCDIAYILMAPDCDADSPYSNNIAYSSNIGFLFLSNEGRCAQISDLTAYSNDYGVFSYFGASNITAKNLILSDNTVSININAVGADNDNKLLTIQDSLFTAVALTDCPECYVAPGSCQSNTAIMLGVATQDGKDMPPRIQDLPWTGVGSIATFNAKQVFSGNTFVNFKDGVLPQCSQNVILKPNNDASDYTPYVQISLSQLINVDQSNLALFETPVADQRCGTFPCTGLNNILIKDLDGSFLGSQGSLIPNNSGVVDSNYCNFVDAMNGYLCTGDQFALLEFESLDIDKLTRVISPVDITNSNGFSNRLNAFKAHNYFTDHLFTRLARFPSIVQRNKNYVMEFAGTLPVNLQFQLEASSAATDFTILKINYYDPQVVSIVNAITGEFINPVPYEFNVDATVRATDPCGTNYFDRTAKTINFMLTADPSCKLLVKKTNVIAVNVRYDMTEDQFYQQGGVARFIDKVASVLGISISRIRVVSIVQGSVILNVEVLSDYQDGNDGAARDQLQTFDNQLQTAYQSGTLNVYGSAGILNYSTNTVLVNGEADTASKPVETVEQRSTLVYAIIIAVAVVIAGLGAFFVYKYKKRMAIRTKKLSAKVLPVTPKLEIKDDPKPFSLGEVPPTKTSPQENDIVFESGLRITPTQHKRNGSLDDFTSRVGFSMIDGTEQNLLRNRGQQGGAPSLSGFEPQKSPLPTVTTTTRFADDSPLKSGEESPCKNEETAWLGQDRSPSLGRPWMARERLRNARRIPSINEDVEKIDV